MEFRKFQIARFVEEVKTVSKITGTIASPVTGELIEEDEYISGIIEEVQEYIIDLTSARRTIINYLNRQIEKGNGLIYQDMKESFLKTNNWVRDLEIQTTGKPAFDETSINPETQKPSLTQEEILQHNYSYPFPAGFTAFTGAQQQEIEAMQNKIENQPDGENPEQGNFEPDPYVKLIDQGEQDWETYFLSKEKECKIYDIAQCIANNLPLLNSDFQTLLDIVTNEEDSDLINDRYVFRINELIGEEEVRSLTACMARTGTLLLAMNTFGIQEMNTDVGISYEDRKALSLTTTLLGTNTTFRPADTKECIQYIFVKGAALRPMTDTDLLSLAAFLEANLEKVKDTEYILGILDELAVAYVESNFLVTGEKLSLAINDVRDKLNEHKSQLTTEE